MICGGYAPFAKEKSVQKLRTKEDVWVLTSRFEDLEAGAHYAAITLPWTFNRMSLNTGSTGQQNRALNIAKGIVGQEMLKRELERVGIKAQTQRKSHRDEDLFDFNVEVGGTLKKFDLKSVHYFTNYAPVGREPFSVDMIMQYAGYADADWRTFFPMLVPHTQIKQRKEGYCFAIASSIDPRKDIATKRTSYALTAFPYGRHLGFLSSKKLCLLREEADKGFYIELLYETNSLFSTDVTMSVIGEWDGELSVIKVKLRAGVAKQVGPFSCISSFQVDKDSYDQLFYGSISISVNRNDFTTPIRNTTRRNTNVVPERPLKLVQNDFCNLFLPTDYKLYVIGWTYKDEFLQACRQYTGWVWPKDSIDKFKNQAWTQITEKDRRNLEGKGFGDSIQEAPRLLKAGWLKTSGWGGGACCYVFPNIGANGGVKETNLYILPQDLYNMDSLKK